MIGSPTENIKNLGTPVRYKMGADFYYSLEGFTLSGELISTSTKLTDVAKDSLKIWSAFKPDLSSGYVGDELKALFYYTTLQYDITPQLFVFGSYSSWENTQEAAVKNPAIGISGGLGYKLTEQAVLKLQYQENKIDGEEYSTPVSPLANLGDAKYKMDYKSTFLMLGVSIAF